MYKTSKLAVIVLYPLVKLVIPLATIGFLGVQLSQGGSAGAGIGLALIGATVLGIMLLVAAVCYVITAVRRKRFEKGPDGKRPADVADYFAMVFCVLLASDVLTGIVKLFS